MAEKGSQCVNVNILDCEFINLVMHLLQGGIQQVLVSSCWYKKKTKKNNNKTNDTVYPHAVMILAIVIPSNDIPNFRSTISHIVRC